MLMAAPFVILPVATANADVGSLRVESFSVTSEFPEGIRFIVRASGDNEITSIAVRFRVGQQTTGAYDYLDFETGRLVDGHLFWRTNSISRYIPPGTIITYNFEVEDSEGNRLDTEPQEFIYTDARFEWSEVSFGSISVAYHGPVQSRAELVLNAIVQTIDHMGPLLGADTEMPIRVTMYNNVKEMLEALPPASATIRRELITEGQAFTDVGTLLVLGGGRLAEGTASHEVTHILTHRAGDSVYRNVPSWLDEGLSEFGNIVPGFSYDVALEFAISNDRLLPITSLTLRPADSEEVIIFYGEGRSIVRYMVRRYGADKMTLLMASLKSGRDIDEALLDVYGVDRLGLENGWRAAIGAPAYVPSVTGSVRPTPIARPTLLPYTLQSQPQASDSPTPVPQQAPTPTPEPTSTPEPSPVASAATEQPTATPLADEAKPEDSTGGGGGACSAPAPGAPRAMDVSLLALVTGLAFLGLRRKMGL